MLTHHSGQDYNVAASEAAKGARDRFQAEIDKGKAGAIAVIEQVERDVPFDRVVPADKLDFFVNDKAIKVRFQDGQTNTFHRHAVQQAASRAEIPLTFIEKLLDRGDWGQELVAENLNRIYHNGGRTKVLTRSVAGQVRGFLSDSYRRMDARPILHSFVQAAQQFGAVPVDGYAMDTKVALKVVLPYVFEPVANEVMIIGAVYENSDFGNGAVSVRSFIERLWCTNRAIGTEDMRKIHLGARLDENLKFSQRTYELDTRTMASAVGDIIGNTLSPGSVNRYLEGVKEANEKKITGPDITKFLKENLLKGEAEEVNSAFNSPEIEMMPAGQSAWRLSNAISWIANTKIDNPERKLEVMKIAGKVLDGVSIKAAA